MGAVRSWSGTWRSPPILTFGSIQRILKHCPPDLLEACLVTGLMHCDAMVVSAPRPEPPLLVPARNFQGGAKVALRDEFPATMSRNQVQDGLLERRCQ